MNFKKILNDFLELKELCCIENKNISKLQKTKKKINSHNLEMRLEEYRKLYLRNTNKEINFKGKFFEETKKNIKNKEISEKKNYFLSNYSKNKKHFFRN